MPRPVPASRFARLTILTFAVCTAGLSLGRTLHAAEQPAPESAAPADVLAGHSAHGEVFNEGARQRAYLMEGTGNIDFHATTNSPEAQKFVNQGVGQLHGCWYFESERSFRQAAAIDPDCAIAYWGMAMSNMSNEKRAKGFIAEAVKRKKNASPREVKYIDALEAYFKADPKKKQKERSQALATAYEKILYDHPEDLDARAFLGLQLWTNRGRGIPIASHLAVDALFQQVLEKNPLHPCHHYVIHLWDYEKPERALKSAATCGQSAPRIAHMWHMPGHIYSRLKRYHDAAFQQEASARVDHAHMIRDRVLPDQIHNFAHNNEWLIRNLNNVGRVHDALELAKNMTELPRHPKYNTFSKYGSAKYGRLRLLDTLNRWELWDEVVALAETPYLEPTEDYGRQIERLQYLGRAHFGNGKVEAGRAILSDLEARLNKLNGEQDDALHKAENEVRKKHKLPTIEQPAASATVASSTADEPAPPELPEDAAPEVPKAVEKLIAAARTNARKPFKAKSRSLERAVNELKGRDAVAAGDFKTGLSLMKKAGGLEAAYLARVQLQAGEKDSALKAVRKQVDSKKTEVYPRAILVEMLWQLDQKDAARKEFATLRDVASDADLDVAPLARLRPIADELGLPADWRNPRTPAEDVGERPSLDDLGPFRWRPSHAPEWSLADAKGNEHSLNEYRGRPVVVIFYLGYGCLHCAEQLQAFAPKADDFADAGISLIAVSTDDREALVKSHENYKDGEFPFPLVSDDKLEVFKKYRAFDDFEETPLHGTFLIDGEGLVRWQDVSYEPFMQADFLLKESKRLLAQPAPPTIESDKSDSRAAAITAPEASTAAVEGAAASAD